MLRLAKMVSDLTFQESTLQRQNTYIRTKHVELLGGVKGSFSELQVFQNKLLEIYRNHKSIRFDFSMYEETMV